MTAVRAAQRPRDGGARESASGVLILVASRGGIWFMTADALPLDDAELFSPVRQAPRFRLPSNPLYDLRIAEA